MRLPDIEQQRNEPLNKTRFSPVIVLAARPWRELRRVRFHRDSDQLGEVRVAYFRADGVEAKLEWRKADASDDATLFIDARDAAERPIGAVPFGYAILNALGVRNPAVKWHSASRPAQRSGWDSTPASIEASPAAVEPAILHAHR